MAVIQLNNGFDMSNFNTYDINDDAAYTTNLSSSGYMVNSPIDGRYIEITGHNLTYDGWSVMDGTFDSVNIIEGGKSIFLAKSLNAWAGISVYESGFEGYYQLKAELAYWMQGTDTIADGDGNEHIMGFSGDDFIIAGAGNDYIDGGKNMDTVYYAGNRQDFSIQKTGDTYTVSSSIFGTDTLANIEIIKFNDQTVSDPNVVPDYKNPTADFLQQKFQLSMTEACNWVIDHLSMPREIYHICSDNGITSDMLAEIVQPHFVATLTGADVNEWFMFQGIPGLA